MMARLLPVVCLWSVVLAGQSQLPQCGNSNPDSNDSKNRAAVAAQSTPLKQILGATNAAAPPPANEQSKLGQALEKAETDPVVWVTVLIAVFAFWQVVVYRQMRDHTIVIERAYVTMSHHRPGLIIDDWAAESASGMTQGDGVPRQNISVNVRVQNSGNTPATVTYRLLQLLFTDQPLTDVPAYDPAQGEVVRVHLVKGDDLNVFANWNIEETAFTSVRSGLNLYLLGYVDYIDKFGRRHRAGYARVYNPSIDTSRQFVLNRSGDRVRNELDADAHTKRNNLPFVTQPGYNYDRERVKGEGNDWDES